jgi:hypothetical protein
MVIEITSRLRHGKRPNQLANCHEQQSDDQK